MTRSHVVLHCPNERLRVARSGGVGRRRIPGVSRVLLANPRWERRFVKFLELSGVGRVMADGRTDEARALEWTSGGGVGCDGENSPSG
jgi:hypothetical protein